MAGTTRAISSSAPMGIEPGRVLSPPMSIIVAPWEMKVRTVEVRWVRSLGECLPPSEKESGVKLRMAMMWVMRLGSVACSAGKNGEMGVVDTGVGSGGGSAVRYSLYVWALFPG